MFRDSLGRVSILIEKMRSYPTKSQERLQNLFDYMIFQHQNFKLQMQNQAVSGFDLYISKTFYQNIFSWPIWILISHPVSILTVLLLNSLVKLLILTLTHHDFELRRGSQHL